jgi:hypothetical protein
MNSIWDAERGIRLPLNITSGDSFLQLAMQDSTTVNLFLSFPVDTIVTVLDPFLCTVLFAGASNVPHPYYLAT